MELPVGSGCVLVLFYLKKPAVSCGSGGDGELLDIINEFRKW